MLAIAMTYSMFQDSVDGSVSSKRVITFFAMCLCAVAFIGNLFFGITMDPKLYDSMMYIVIAGLGFTASEKFSPQKPRPAVKTSVPATPVKTSAKSSRSAA